MNAKARHARLLIESTIDALKDAQTTHPNTRYSIEFSIQVPPEEGTDSQTLSALDALLGAVKRFDENKPLRLVLNVPVQSALQDDILSSIEAKVQRVLALELPKAPPREE